MARNECGRFEAEGFLQQEAGGPMDPHFQTCADCLRAQAAYAQLTAGLSRLPRAAPPEGWQDRVWDEVRAQRPRAQVRRLWPVAVPLLAAAAALVLVVWPEAARDPSLEVSRLQGARQLRGGSAQPGDSLRLSARRAGHRHAELRLYRDGVLVFRCGSPDPCEEAGRQLQADVPLQAVGRYASVLLLSEDAVPGPGAELAQDLEAAVRAGARVITAPVVDVY
jgi:hypothetical protein